MQQVLLSRCVSLHMCVGVVSLIAAAAAAGACIAATPRGCTPKRLCLKTAGGMRCQVSQSGRQQWWQQWQHWWQQCQGRRGEAQGVGNRQHMSVSVCWFCGCECVRGCVFVGGMLAYSEPSSLLPHPPTYKQPRPLVVVSPTPLSPSLPLLLRPQVPCAATCTMTSRRTCGRLSSRCLDTWHQSHSGLCCGTQVRVCMCEG